MAQSILGIDVSKDTLDVVLLQGENKAYASFNNHKAGFARLARWFVSRGAGQVHACLEATGQYGDSIAEYLYQSGQLVSVVNPARIKRYGDSKLHRNKTDKADAALIAEFCYKENPALWAPLPPSVKQLRQLVRRFGGCANELPAGTQPPCLRSYRPLGDSGHHGPYPRAL